MPDCPSFLASSYLFRDGSLPLESYSLFVADRLNVHDGVLSQLLGRAGQAGERSLEECGRGDLGDLKEDGMFVIYVAKNMFRKLGQLFINYRKVAMPETL
jgi:hypothetical protein